MRDRIHNTASQLQEELVKIRRHLHMNPELSFQEEKTAKFIASELDKLKVEYTTGWAGHGIVATLKNNLNESKKTIALRADIDALPILESVDRPYRSKNDGVMHACGHDVHTTCLLGAIKTLLSCQDLWEGTIMCIFQPAEEKLPGGASIMIKEGLFDKIKPELIIGQHVHPPLEVGYFGFHAGPYMASADELYVEIIGKGGHAALPDNYTNPLIIASEFLLALENLRLKYVENKEDVIICFGKINSDGGATNVVPDRINIHGTFRAMDEQLRFNIHQEMQSIAAQISEKYKAKCHLIIKVGYPVLNNDISATKALVAAAKKFLPHEKIIDLPKRMTSEDFAFYSHLIPAVFYRMGTGNLESGITSPVHTSTFDVDESCLSQSVGMMAYLAITALNS